MQPHPHQQGLIFSSCWNFSQKSDIATLSVLCGGLGQYGRVQVAISRYSGYSLGGGGVTRVEGVNSVKWGGNTPPPPLQQAGPKIPSSLKTRKKVGDHQSKCSL
jgi:hypothetical protein